MSQRFKRSGSLDVWNNCGDNSLLSSWSPAWWLKPRQRWEDISCLMVYVQKFKKDTLSRYAWKRWGQDQRPARSRWRFITVRFTNILFLCHVEAMPISKSSSGKTSLMVRLVKNPAQDCDKWIGIHPYQRGDIGSIRSGRRSACHGEQLSPVPRLLKPADWNCGCLLQDKTPQRETCASQLQSRLRWPQLEKACRKQWRPTAQPKKQHK